MANGSQDEPLEKRSSSRYLARTFVLFLERGRKIKRAKEQITKERNGEKGYCFKILRVQEERQREKYKEMKFVRCVATFLPPFFSSRRMTCCYGNNTDHMCE